MIELPWLPRELQPNRRAHYMAKARAVKKARQWAFLATKAADIHAGLEGRLDILLTFYPPTAHCRDKDNLLSASKAYLDGIAEALCVDDSRFDPRVQIAEPVRNGRVNVSVRPHGVGDLIEPLIERCADFALLHLHLRSMPAAEERKRTILHFREQGSLTADEATLLIQAYQLETA